MPWGAYRQGQPSRPSPPAPRLDDTTRTVLIVIRWVVGGTVGVAAFVLLAVFAPLLLCGLLVVAVIVVFTLARLSGWKPRGRRNRLF
jgi:fatty acid desaturase